MEKTGSTAVQHWLNEQREQMEREGWHVPTTLGKLNHRLLSLLAFNPGRRDDATRRRSINNNEQLLTLQTEVKTRLRKEFGKAKEKECRAIIASSELISSRLTTETEKNRLLAALMECGATSIQIILVTRDPADLAESRHSTAVLHEQRTDKHPPKPGSKEADLFGKQKRLATEWEAACREVPIEATALVMSYETGIARHHSICTMIAQELGMSKILQSQGLKTRKNEKLSKETLTVLRWINKIEKTLGRVLGKTERTVRLFEQIRVMVVSLKYGKKPYVLPQELREDYERYYT